MVRVLAGARASGGGCTVRDVWAHKAGTLSNGKWAPVVIGPHDSAFVVIAPRSIVKQKVSAFPSITTSKHIFISTSLVKKFNNKLLYKPPSCSTCVLRR